MKGNSTLPVVLWCLGLSITTGMQPNKYVYIKFNELIVYKAKNNLGFFCFINAVA